MKQKNKKPTGRLNPYRLYERDKKQICKKALSPKEYEENIKKFANKRGV